MPQPLSFDLRSRVLAAIDTGMSCRWAGERFGVSASSAIRWAALRRSEGSARPKPQGGDRLSHKTEAHAGLIHAALDEVPDITLPELKAGSPVKVQEEDLFDYLHYLPDGEVEGNETGRLIDKRRGGPY